MKLKALGIFILSLVLFTSCQQESEPLSVEPETQVESIIPGQYIVLLQPDDKLATSEMSYQKKLSYVASKAQQMGVSLENIKNLYGSAIQGFAAKLSKEEVMELKKNKNVRGVYPDMVVSLGFGRGGPVPAEDPSQVIPYGIERVGYGDGTGKTVWIIDTGVDLDHPDLLVDASKGYDFINDDPYADDDNGHGSHCAGTVAALNNDIGVVGVAAGATIVPVKVLDRRGSGAYSVIIAGVDFVAEHASPGDAANMSLGGSAYDPIDEAVYNASQKGIFFALAAGNEDDDANLYSPARVNGPYIWTISAMDENDVWAYFSNYGNPPVDYCMPGVYVYSTYKDGGYETLSGTSMAAPHMCGVLLMTNGQPKTDGYVIDDPDGTDDPIGHL